MERSDTEMEALLRATLREEAGALWPPAILWPHLSAAQVQPADGAPALAVGCASRGQRSSIAAARTALASSSRPGSCLIALQRSACF